MSTSCFASTDIYQEMKPCKDLNPGMSGVRGIWDMNLFVLGSGALERLGSGRLLQRLGVESLDLGCGDDNGWRTLSQFNKARINPM